LSESASNKARKSHEKADAVRAFLSRLPRALAWPGLYGWIGIVFAAVGAWFAVGSGLLYSKLSRLEEPGHAAALAAESARRRGFGETARQKGPPFGFMSPALRPRRPATSEGPDAARPKRARGGDMGRTRVVPDPLEGRALEAAREGVRANAGSSAVFGAFCLVTSAFWWGFRLFDPGARTRPAPEAAPDSAK
jgi:hypothetical protein